MQLSAKAAPVCSIANRVFMNGLYAFIYTVLLIYLGEQSCFTSSCLNMHMGIEQFLV